MILILRQLPLQLSPLKRSLKLQPPHGSAPAPPRSLCPPAQLGGGLLCGAVYVVQEGARHAVHLNQLVWTVNVHRYSIEYTFTVNNRAFSNSVAKLLKLAYPHQVDC